MAKTSAISSAVETFGHGPMHSKMHGTIDVPHEVPVELRYNGEPYATMMASPDDLTDFATGFTLTEAIAPDVSAIKALTVAQGDHGFTIDIAIHGTAYAALLREGARAIPGRSSCGICGVRTLDDARRALPRAAGGLPIANKAIARAVAALKTQHGMHGSAFCDPSGALILTRQDVGRHNALDKLIGAMAHLSCGDAADGFCLITSRCSYEMVQKAVRGGFATLVAVSSPTTLALEIAGETNLRLYALAGASGATLFVDPEVEQVVGDVVGELAV